MFDQAAGLRRVASGGGVRVLPVVLPRDADAAFDLAWVLGSGWSAMGHAVVTLDAASREQADRPGLAQRLKQGAAPLSADDSAWQVLPSQSGLQTLLHLATTQGPGAALNRLAACFGPDVVVLLLAPKEWVSVLLEGTDVHPLVPLTFQPAGVVDAYSALKVLHQAAGLQPVLVPMPSNVPESVAVQAQHVLQDTAHRHLGWVPAIHPLPDQGAGASPDTISQWMLRMLENALLLEESGPVGSSWPSSSQREALVPQLWSC
jgi:hypothetical protein